MHRKLNARLVRWLSNPRGVNCTLLLVLLGLSACGGDGGGREGSDDERTKYFNETSTNWSMTRGYPRGTAYNPYERELDPGTVANLRVLWTKPSTASPVLQWGDHLLAGDAEAVSAADGASLWAGTAEEASAPGVVCKGIVYRTDGGIRGTNVSTGALRLTLPRADSDAGHVFGTPIAKGPNLVIPVLFERWAELGGAETTTYRLFDVTTQLTAYLHSNFVSLAPGSVTGGRLYAPGLSATQSGAGSDWSYTVFALSLDPALAADTLVWATRIDEHVAAQAPELGVSVIDGHVYAVSPFSRSLVALDQKTGKRLWQVAIDARPVSLASTFDAVFVAGTRDDGSSIVASFSTQDGARRFVAELGEGALSGRIAVGGDVLYAGSSTGFVYAVSAKDGALLKQVHVGGTVGDPVVSRGRVFVPTGDSLVALGVSAQLGPAVENPDNR